MKIDWNLHWSGTCWYGFCSSEKVWERERRRVLKKSHVDIGDYPQTTGMVTVYETPDKRALVTLNSEVDSNPGMLLNSIAHESVHVACVAFRQMNEDEPGEETLAYSIGVIAENIFNAYVQTRGEGLRRLKNGS